MSVVTRKSDRLVIDASAVGVLAAFTLGVYFVGISPTRSATQERSAAEVRLYEANRDLQDIHADLARADAQRKAVLERKKKDNVKLEPASAITARQKSLTTLAGETGVEVTALNVAKPLPGVKTTVVPIAFAGKAPYESCEAFIASLRRQFPDVAVIGLSLKPPAEGKGRFTEMTCDLYWYADGAGRAGSASAEK